jgi:undecaprenyl diphosphate synthase
MNLKEQIDLTRVPKHIAIIMDGNGRWAQKQGQERLFGHSFGVDSVRDTVKGARELGVKYLTMYAFSTENWGRPKAEVDGLMELMVNTIVKELPDLMKQEIRIHGIGNLNELPLNCQNELKHAIEETTNNDNLHLILALNYSSKWELTEATKQIAAAVEKGDLSISEITDKTISEHLSTKNFPDPELLIRTSGEQRLSNYLLWQLAYAEFYFTEVLWPDFNEEELYKAVIDYQQRERRFGKTSSQLMNG